MDFSTLPIEFQAVQMYWPAFSLVRLNSSRFDGCSWIATAKERALVQNLEDNCLSFGYITIFCDSRPFGFDLRKPFGLTVQNDRLVQEAGDVLQIACDHRLGYWKWMVIF